MSSHPRTDGLRIRLTHVRQLVLAAFEAKLADSFLAMRGGLIYTIIRSKTSEPFHWASGFIEIAENYVFSLGG